MIYWKGKSTLNFLEILSLIFILRKILCDKPRKLFKITKKSITTLKETIRLEGREEPVY